MAHDFSHATDEDLFAEIQRRMADYRMAAGAAHLSPAPPKKRGPKNQAPTSGPLLNLRLFVFHLMQGEGLTQGDIAEQLGGLSRPVISRFLATGQTSAAVNQCLYFWAKEHGYTGDNQ